MHKRICHATVAYPYHGRRRRASPHHGHHPAPHHPAPHYQPRCEFVTKPVCEKVPVKTPKYIVVPVCAAVPHYECKPVVKQVPRISEFILCITELYRCPTPTARMRPTLNVPRSQTRYKIQYIELH